MLSPKSGGKVEGRLTLLLPCPLPTPAFASAVHAVFISIPVRSSVRRLSPSASTHVLVLVLVRPLSFFRRTLSRAGEDVGRERERMDGSRNGSGSRNTVASGRGCRAGAGADGRERKREREREHRQERERMQGGSRSGWTGAETGAETGAGAGADGRERKLERERERMQGGSGSGWTGAETGAGAGADGRERKREWERERMQGGSGSGNTVGSGNGSGSGSESRLPRPSDAPSSLSRVIHVIFIFPSFPSSFPFLIDSLLFSSPPRKQTVSD